MAFAFPANHRERLVLDKPGDWRAPAIIAMQKMGWTVGNAYGDPIVATTSYSLASWSETIEIWIEPTGIMTISSKCMLVTQCVDWGKNRKNVDQFIQTLEAEIGRRLTRSV